MTEIEKSIGEQMVDLLQGESQHYDVVFSVGPQKIKVKAVRFILKAASPVFKREFKEKWESAVIKEEEGIPLQDVDPDAFELFVQLIISDKWCVDALNSLDLNFYSMLNLLRLCRRFEITKGIKNLEEAADPLIQYFYTFKDTSKFLNMSRENMETILSCEAIPLDEKEIFDYACRWARRQCKQKKMELTGENFREVLGSCFFEIRFPTMKFEVFTKISVFTKNLFTSEERLAVYDFIGLDDDEKAKFDKSLLPFKTNPRGPENSFGCSVLRLPKQFKITANPPFACDGNVTCNFFQVNKKISLRGVGFLGPSDEDTIYDVTFRYTRIVDDLKIVDSGTLRKRLVAQKKRIFIFLFDEPIVIEPNSYCYDNSWKNKCYVEYSLKGTSSVSNYIMENPKCESVEISGVEFNLGCSWSSGRPLAEILYKLI